LGCGFLFAGKCEKAFESRNLFTGSAVYVNVGRPAENLVRALISDTDERLLIEAAQRDPSRFSALYEGNFERVYAYVMKRVRENGEVLFSSICHEMGMTRDSIIVTFLAILELIRRHRVTYEQPEPFDDIRILPITPTSN